MRGVPQGCQFVWLVVALAALIACDRLPAQTTSLNVSSATAGPGATVVLSLALSGAGTSPAGLEWTLTYPPNQISAITAVAGTAATTAGKVLSCATGAGYYTCLLTGLNVNTIAPGVVANFQVTLAANATTMSAGLINTVGVDATGVGLAVSGAGSTITVSAVSSLQCASGILSPGTAVSCAVTLTNAAPPGGSAVALASSNPLLAVPGKLTVAAGTMQAKFIATASTTITSNQSATVTSTLGASARTTVIALQPAVVVGEACNPRAVLSGGTVACDVTISQAVSAATSIALSSSSGLLSIPSTLTIPAGSVSGRAIATVGTIAAATVTTISATLGASSTQTTVSLRPIPKMSSLSCSPGTITVGTTTTCTVAISFSTETTETVNISSGNPALIVPVIVSVLPGHNTATFQASGISRIGAVLVTASYGGTTAFTNLNIQAVSSSSPSALRTAPSGSPDTPGRTRLTSILCKPAMLRVGAQAICQIELENSSDSSATDLDLSSSDESLRLPATITVPPGQVSARFRIDRDSPSSVPAAVISAQLGADAVQDTLSLVRQPAPLGVPLHLYARIGTRVQFRVVSSGSGASLAASGLPAGAILDSTSGLFEWTPDATQQGTQQITFTALSPTGAFGHRELDP